jgi:hypothetical protein
VGAAARLIPAAATANFGFECRLGEALPRADFLVSASAAGGGREILAGVNTGIRLPGTLADDAVWRRVLDFCGRWADPTSSLYDGADYLWLEFDIDGPPSGLPVPNVFFSPQRSPGPVAAEEGSAGARQRACQLVEMGADILRGAPLPRAHAKCLSACFRALPKSARVFQAGFMLARNSDAVRLCVRDLSSARILEYLIRIGWGGDPTALQSVLDALSPLVGPICLDIDVSAAVSHKIGLECRPRSVNGGQPGTEQPWDLFLDYLVERGLCLPAKRDALLTYPGICSEQTDAERWPANLTRISEFLGGRTIGLFIRTLYHVKIVYQPRCPLEAKAYLLAAQRWRGYDA